MKNMRFLLIAVVFTVSLFACDSDQRLSKKTGLSDRAISKKPRVSAVSAVQALPGGFGSTLNPPADDPDDHYITVSFDREMNASTINTNTVYLNDVTAGTPVKIAGQTVEYDGSQGTNGQAVVKWQSATATIMELVVTKDVEDINGEKLNGLTSAGGYSDQYPFNEVNCEYRCEVAIGANTWAPNYFPEMIRISVGGVTATDAVVTAQTQVAATADVSTVTASNFQISPAASGDPAVAGDVNVGLQLDYTGLLAENTLYTVTLTGTDAFAIDHTDATRTYPDTTTALPIIGGEDIVVTDLNGNYLNNGNDNVNDYIVMFITPYTASITPPTATRTDVTQDLGYLGYTNLIEEIDYSIEMDETQALDEDNYLVTDGAGNRLEIDVEPFYRDTDTFFHRVTISTLNHSRNAIATIRIKHTVVSTTGFHIDGDGDGILEQGYNIDDDIANFPDDWEVL